MVADHYDRHGDLGRTPQQRRIWIHTMERSNIATQSYRDQDCGRLKVQVLAFALQELDATFEVTEWSRPALPILDVVFCAVDRISTRAAI